jgi:hypothetical protein
LGPYSLPTIEDFKAYFFRDFPYGTDPSTSVIDQDISNAYLSAAAAMNQKLFQDQQSFNVGWLLLSAHYMVMNLRASSQGVSGQFGWLQASKGVGSVNEGFSIPQRILDNPEFSYLTKTNYGAQYLMMILPLLTGQMFSVCGRTLP